MNRIEQAESRRRFLKRASLAALAFPLLTSCKSSALAQKNESVLSLIRKNAAPAGAEGMGAINFPGDVSWKTALAKKSDRDEPLIISGTVYAADGQTPAPNILIYFYHTDGEGFYGRGGGEPRHGHFQGWLLTGARGRYEFSSIKPAAYPIRKFAAHVHMTVTGENFREDWIDSILFAGDPLITVQEREQAGKRGGFNPIITLEKDAGGIWHGRRDIQLRQV